MAGRIDIAEIERRFTVHEVSEETFAVMAAVRSQIKEAAAAVALHAPEGREKSLAVTALEEAVMWASKALSRPGSE